MTEREQSIVRAILAFLDKLDGGQATEVLIHAAAQTAMRNEGHMPCSLAEFNKGLLACDQRGWVAGLQGKVTRQMKWSLTDVGAAALLELQ